VKAQKAPQKVPAHHHTPPCLKKAQSYVKAQKTPSATHILTSAFAKFQKKLNAL
jgi:hypothetical protein